MKKNENKICPTCNISFHPVNSRKTIYCSHKCKRSCKPKLNLINKIFGRLLVIKEIDPKIQINGSKRRQYKCLCVCGNYVIRQVSNLMTDFVVQSCGCFNGELISNRNFKHGFSKTLIYGVWGTMKGRCLNPDDHKYKDYGGRGIKICDDWLMFENFIKDMEVGYKKGLSIDRIDVNGNYDKLNCRWATPKEQANNKRVKKSNPFVT